MGSFQNTNLESRILHRRQNQGWGFENPKILHMIIGGHTLDCKHISLKTSTQLQVTV